MNHKMARILLAGFVVVGINTASSEEQKTRRRVHSYDQTVTWYDSDGNQSLEKPRQEQYEPEDEPFLGTEQDSALDSTRGLAPQVLPQSRAVRRGRQTADKNDNWLLDRLDDSTESEGDASGWGWLADDVQLNRKRSETKDSGTSSVDEYIPQKRTETVDVSSERRVRIKEHGDMTQSSGRAALSVQDALVRRTSDRADALQDRYEWVDDGELGRELDPSLQRSMSLSDSNTGKNMDPDRPADLLRGGSGFARMEQLIPSSEQLRQQIIASHITPSIGGTAPSVLGTSQLSDRTQEHVIGLSKSPTDRWSASAGWTSSRDWSGASLDHSTTRPSVDESSVAERMDTLRDIHNESQKSLWGN